MVFQNKDLTETTIKSDILYRGRIIDVEMSEIKLPNGERAYREVSRHPGAVCILPLTKDHTVIMEEQWRAGFGGLMLEIPAGKLNSKEENPLDAAKRELREETGAIPENVLDLGLYYGSPAILDEKIHMYLATGLSFGETSYDEDEFMNLKEYPIEELVQMVLDGKIPDGKTQAAVLRVYMMIQKGEIQ